MSGSIDSLGKIEPAVKSDGQQGGEHQPTSQLLSSRHVFKIADELCHILSISRTLHKSGHAPHSLGWITIQVKEKLHVDLSDRYRHLQKILFKRRRNLRAEVGSGSVGDADLDERQV